MFISKEHAAKQACFPFSHQLREKASSGGHFSHSSRRSPNRSGLRGRRTISHFLRRLFHLRSASPAEARWSSLSPLRRLTRQPRQLFLFDQLSSAKEARGSEKTKMELLLLNLTSESLIMTSDRVFATSMSDRAKQGVFLF